MRPNISEKINLLKDLEPNYPTEEQPQRNGASFLSRAKNYVTRLKRVPEKVQSPISPPKSNLNYTKRENYINLPSNKTPPRDQSHLKSQGSNMLFSPVSFTSGLQNSRKYKRLESFDFSNPEWINLDLFQSHSALSQQDLFILEGERAGPYLFLRKLWRFVECPILLFLIGFIAAGAGFILNYCIDFLIGIRTDLTPVTLSEYSRPFIYALICFVLAMSSALLTHFIYPRAAGGGVPEMKSVLSGSINPALLSPRLVLVKTVGLILAASSGLSVGKEGPLIHICCAMAELIMSLPIFNYIRVNTPLRVEILTCACAAGVAASFGSAFGATVFSVEITSTCYVVSGLGRAFATATVVTFIYWFWQVRQIAGLYEGPSQTDYSFIPVDLILWCFLGLICGLLGWGFVGAISTLSRWRNKVTRVALGMKVQRKRKLLICAFFTCLVIPLSYWERRYFESQATTTESALVDYMFAPKVFGLSWTLPAYVVIKAMAILFSVTQPLPVGLFAPVFTLGAAFGRLFGEAMNYFKETHGLFQFSFEPWEFSVVGAAACSGSITGAISTAIIVFEMTGKSSLKLPLGLAVLISHHIASRFTKGIYESLVDTNSAPYLPTLPPQAYLVEVQSIMVPAANLPYLALSTTYSTASRVLSHHSPSPCAIIPVVQTTHDMILVGAVLRKDLEVAVQDYEERVARLEEDASPEETLQLMEAVKVYERKQSSADIGNSRRPSFAYKFSKSGHVQPTSKRRAVSESFIKEDLLIRKDSLHGTLLGGAHLRFVVMKGESVVAPVCDTKGMHYYSQHMLRLSSIDTIPIVMDPSPLQVAHSTELRKLDYMFRMLKLDVAFVCRAGKLVGWVTRGTIRRFVGNREPKPMDECVSLCDSLFLIKSKKGSLNNGSVEGKIRPRHNEYHSLREEQPSHTWGPDQFQSWADSLNARPI